MTNKPTPTGTLVRQWVEAYGNKPFTSQDVTDYIMEACWDDARRTVAGTYEHPEQVRVIISQRVSVTAATMVKEGAIRACGLGQPKSGNGRRFKLYVRAEQESKAALDRPAADSQPEPEQPAAPTMPDVITDHQMGRSIYNYITRLRGELAASEDRVRKGQDQYRLAMAEHRGQLDAKDERIRELEHELAEVRVKLQAQTVIRRPAVRTMAIGELIGQG